jgi:DNA-binding response OmpR family regulator
MPSSILLVENDQNLRQSIALILKRAGYYVTGTDHVEKLVDLLDSRAYDLLILDLDIAKTRQLLRLSYNINNHGMPILILTGHSISKKEPVDGLPTVSYLVKPIAPETILERIGKLLQ